MGNKLVARVWKSLETMDESLLFANQYIIETSEGTDTAGFYQAIQNLAQAEQHISTQGVTFQRIDVAPCGPTGQIEGKEGFSTVRFVGTGIRDTEGHGGTGDTLFGLLIFKDTYNGRSGRAVYRGAFYEGEINQSNKHGVRWNASEKWIYFHWKWFREHMHNAAITHFVGRRAPNSDVIVDYAPLYTFGVGTPIKLATLHDAQTRKRPEGLNARLATNGAAQAAHMGWWHAHDLVAAYGEQIPFEELRPAVTFIGGAVAAYEPIKKYFEDFQAPPYNSTRWERPRADPHRDKAAQAVLQWKAQEVKFQLHMQALTIDPVTGKVSRGWVEGLQDIGKDTCAFCNVVLYSRFT